MARYKVRVNRRFIGVLVAACIAVLGAACLFGAASVSIFSPTPEQKLILYSMRVPRVLMGFFVGGALSMCGVVYQSLFRNSLASPYTLGISSGAALGAAVSSIVWGSTLGLTLSGITGAGGAVFLLLFLNRSHEGAHAARLLLSGVMISFFFSSLILFSQFLGDFTAIIRLTRWLMGSVETVGYYQLGIISAVTLVGLVCCLRLAPELSLLSLGEEIARSKGVEVNRIVWILFAVTSLLIGVVVSVCGPIGFVGVAIPLAVRGAGIISHREQLLFSFFLGGMLLVICDAVGRSIIAPAEIPVGVISALIGAPVVIGLISRRGISAGY